MIGLMKDEKDSKIMAKFVATAPKSYPCCAQKRCYSELIEDKGAKQLVNKKFRIFDWEKCVFDSINAPITKQ